MGAKIPLCCQQSGICLFVTMFAGCEAKIFCFGNRNLLGIDHIEQSELLRYFFPPFVGIQTMLVPEESTFFVVSSDFFVVSSGLFVVSSLFFVGSGVFSVVSDSSVVVISASVSITMSDIASVSFGSESSIGVLFVLRISRFKKSVSASVVSVSDIGAAQPDSSTTVSRIKHTALKISFTFVFFQHMFLPLVFYKLHRYKCVNIISR